MFGFLGRRRDAATPREEPGAPHTGGSDMADVLPSGVEVQPVSEPHTIPPVPARSAPAANESLAELQARKLPRFPAAYQPRRVAIEPSDETQFAQTVLQNYSNRMIGELLQEQGHLTQDQVLRVLDYQRDHPVRFGEAAVSLGLVKGSDALWALSKQFGYDYAPATTSDEAQRFGEDLMVARHPFSSAAETIRDLRSELLSGVLNPEQPLRPALAVVSLDAGDGRSWLAANLAVSLSQLGAKTLLVDANLRNPRQHEIFGLGQPKSGLTGILHRHQRAEVLRPMRALPNLHLLPAGAVPPNPLEILQGRGFTELMHKLRTGFTHVIVDTPAATAGADARLVAARCGASLLVARKGRSSLPGLKDLAQLLSKGQAQFAGLVVNEI